MQHWVFAYDVPDDRRRTRLAKVLEDFGDRMQWSVFEIIVEQRDLELLLRRVRAVIDPAEDAVRLYPLCAGCLPKVLNLGKDTRKPFDNPDVIIV